MSVEEARQVLWLRPTQRPVGDLLDSGELDRSDLEWAAARAYNPRLRLAASVLLDHLAGIPKATELPVSGSIVHPASSASNISMEQARSVVWPFSPYRGQCLGILLQDHLITLKDLAYAVENARERRVRDAATTLLLKHLAQRVQEPDEAQGFLNVVSTGRSFSERRQIFLSLLEGMVLGLVLGAAIMWMVADVWSRVTNPKSTTAVASLPPTVIVVSVVILVILGIGLIMLSHKAFEAFSSSIEKRRAFYRKGEEAEERVAALMHSVLDGNWFLFRNVMIPGSWKSDVDAIVVGPPGIWVLEIKALAGTYRNVGTRWEFFKASGWQPTNRNPSEQAQRNAARVAAFLKADGISQWVNPVVVWADPGSTVTVENPAVAVWTLERMVDELGNIWHDENVPEAVRQRIVNKLTQLCQEQRAAN